MPSILRTLIAAALTLGACGQLAAAEIKLLTAGAMRGVVDALLPAFETTTGHKVVVDNATAGTLAKRIEGGEAFDVAIITPQVIDDLASKGKVSGGRVGPDKVRMGVAG